MIAIFAKVPNPFREAIPVVGENPRISIEEKKYSYAETSSKSILTMKGAKCTKMDDQMARFFLRDLRVLRGEESNDRFGLEL